MYMNLNIHIHICIFCGYIYIYDPWCLAKLVSVCVFALYILRNSAAWCRLKKKGGEIFFNTSSHVVLRVKGGLGGKGRELLSNRLYI